MPETTPTTTLSDRDGPPDAILIHETDNVAVCLEDLAAGDDAVETATVSVQVPLQIFPATAASPVVFDKS